MDSIDRHQAAARSPEVGDGILAPGGTWTFGGETPRAFDEHIARSVPTYGECHDLIVDICAQLVPAGGRCYDLGCSTGSLTARLGECLAPRGADVIGVDREPGMIERAAHRCTALRSVRFACSALEDLELEPADVVVSFYTIQFVEMRKRQTVLERIRRALEPAGSLILFEKVLAPTARFQDVAEGTFFEFKRRQGFSDQEITEKARSLRGVLQPLSADENDAMLKRAGFTEIMRIFRWVVFDGVIASVTPFPATSRADGGSS
jgi:tRNA (cmo5U34)-methyltransferase